jgi:hypothetical protein
MYEDFEPECQNQFSIVEHFFPGLSVLPSDPPRFWSLDSGDLFSFASMTVVTASIWLVTVFTVHKYGILSYWDGPNYIYAGITLYRIPEDHPWNRSFDLPQSYFACHLPGFPFAIRLFSLPFLNNFLIGTHFAIYVISLILVYAFRRVLWIYEAAKYPTRSAVLLSLLPLRFVPYHTVGASEPLFLVFVCFAFIFFRTNRFVCLFVAIAGACLTRVEGLALWGTIGLCYLLRMDIRGAVIVGCDLIAPIGLLFFHHCRFGDWRAYVHYNQGQSGLLRSPAFFEIFDGALGGDLGYHLSALSLFCVFVVGAILIFPVSVPIGIFSAVYVCFVSFVFHLDIFRYALPGYVFAVFVGFDDVWSAKVAQKPLLVLLPFYAVLAGWYTIGQMKSNSAAFWFTEEILETPAKWF